MGEIIINISSINEKSKLEQTYGIEFEQDQKIIEQAHNNFYQTCVALQNARNTLQSLCDELHISHSDAAPFIPDAFLHSPLTPEKKTQINAQETPAIAEFCVGIQAQLSVVPVEESFERLVHIPTQLASYGTEAVLSDTPFHDACGEWAGQRRQFWAREGFANRITVFSKMLDAVGVRLRLEDGFRPVGVQEGLFKRRVAWTRRDHPDWDDETIITEAKSKTAVTPRLASHKGGAALDAQILDKSTGKILDFGHKYPEGGALVFPKSPFVTAEQWQNRQLFKTAAELSGLTLYVGEDWHVSYGDNLASLDLAGNVRPDYVAQYGPIKDFDRRTGQITQVYTPQELDATFEF